MSSKPIELEAMPVMCGFCQQPIAEGVPFVPVMYWRDEPVDTMRAGPDGFPLKRTARLAHVVAGMHIECMGHPVVPR